MIVKKRITISGRLLFPLQEGYKAIIIHSGGVIHTSRVVEVIKTDTDHVLFETMNSVYWVSLVADYSESALQKPLKMCA